MRVRYYGPVGLPSGYGDAANEFCMAMHAAGIDFEILTPAAQLHRDYADLAGLIRGDDDQLTPDPDVVIIHNLPLSCSKTLVAARVRETCPRAKLVAYTTWEGLRAPVELLKSLSAFSHVWVPSLRTAMALDIGDLFTTRVIHHANDGLPFAIPGKPSSGDYRFYSIGAWTVRKNMEGVIRAYLRAFGKEDDVVLRMHCRGASPEIAYATAVAATGKPPEDLPEICFTNTSLTNQEVAEIHENGDCFVSASRGESWNLPAFDAVRSGNHIIATAGLGHDEFLYHTSSWKVESRIVPASGEVVMKNDNGVVHGQYIGGDCLTIKETWRDPDIDRMAEMMRTAASERPELTVRHDLHSMYSRAKAGEAIKQALEEVMKP